MSNNETFRKLIVPFNPETIMLEGYGAAIPLLPEPGIVIGAEFEKVPHPGVDVGVGVRVGVGVGAGVADNGLPVPVRLILVAQHPGLAMVNNAPLGPAVRGLNLTETKQTPPGCEQVFSDIVKFVASETEAFNASEVFR